MIDFVLVDSFVVELAVDLIAVVLLPELVVVVDKAGFVQTIFPLQHYQT